MAALTQFGLTSGFLGLYRWVKEPGEVGDDMTRDGSDRVPVVGRWVVWLLVAVMVGLFVFDVLVPPIVVLPFIGIPVVLAAVWFPPRVVAGLTGLGVLMALVSGWVNDYFASFNDVLMMVAMLSVGLVAIVASLTRVRVEGQRDEAALRLRATVDAQLDPYVLLTPVRDSTGRIVDFVFSDANDAACVYNGIPREQLIGARLLDILPGHLSTGLLDTYRNVVETGEPLVLDDFAYDQELRGGAERRYDIRGVKVGDAISYTWRDITERSETARRIAESEEQYRLLAANTTDIVLRARDDTVIWVSPALTNALGWRPEDWVGHSAT